VKYSLQKLSQIKFALNFLPDGAHLFFCKPLWDKLSIENWSSLVLMIEPISRMCFVFFTWPFSQGYLLRQIDDRTSLIELLCG